MHHHPATDTLLLELTDNGRTRLLARIVTAVAGRGLSIERMDLSASQVSGSAVLLLRVSGHAGRLRCLASQLERLVGVLAVESTADQMLRRAG